MLKRIFTFVVFVSLFLVSATYVLAQEITVEVSGNGDGSANSANVAVTQETTITQTNTANIQNNVNSNTNTGDNSANSNTGDQTNITTGNVNQEIGISNSANSSTVDLNNCCPQNLIITNSDNGSNSQNNINTEVSNKTSIVVVNEANITNSVNLTANTGRNQASQNEGSVAIDTGNIKISGEIRNSTNKSHVKATSGSNTDILITNKSNGANSINNIILSIFNELNIKKLDIANISNEVEIDANTGENIANDNLGDVLISTGDIEIDFSIINDPINFSTVNIGCECIEGGPQPPPPICDPCGQEEQPPQLGILPSEPAAAGPSGPSAGPSGPGQVLAAAITQLPVTGPGGLLFLLLLWISLFLTGVVLKILGNRSPPAVLNLWLGRYLL